MNNSLRQLLLLYRGRILGTTLGIVLALMWIFLGFWSMAFVVVCGVVGYYIGVRFDGDEDFRAFLERVLPPVD